MNNKTTWLVLIIAGFIIGTALILGLGSPLGWLVLQIAVVLAALHFKLKAGIAAAITAICINALLFIGSNAPLEELIPQSLTILAIAGLIGWYSETQQSSEENFNRVSLVDRTTGLHNYSYFINRLDEEKKRADRFGSRLSLIILDIDLFKPFNDEHGHEMGNNLLKQISDILKIQVRGIDIVSRYGGEEFAILLPNTGRNAAQEIGERIRQTVADTNFSINNITANITISGGIATYPDDAEDDLKLIDRADQALNIAKDSGRNKVLLCEKQV